MGPSETQAAVGMFEAILEWIHLTKGLSNKIRRKEIVKWIVSWTEEIVELKDELYLQLLKQTRGNVTHFQRWSTWKLFGILVEFVTCSTDLAHCLLPYIKLISSAAEEDPMVRMLAYVVYDTIHKDHPLTVGRRIRAPSGWIKSDDVTACQVLSADGRSVEVVYDRETLVADGVKQAAWSVGIQNWDSFMLFLDGDVHLDNDARLAAVLNADGIQDDHRVRVYFKQVLFSEAKAEMRNADYVRLLYCQLKQEYLINDFPVSPVDALKLCMAQLFAESGSDVFFDENELFNKLRECIPKTVTVNTTRCHFLLQCFARRRSIAWAKDAQDYFARKNIMRPEDAQRWFLEMMHTHSYGESISFSIQLVKCNHKELSEKRTSLAVVTPRRIDFFDLGMTRCQLSIKMERILSCDSSAVEEVVLASRKKLRRYCIRMNMSNASLFRRLVIAYSEEAKCDRKTPKHRATTPPLREQACQNQSADPDGEGLVAPASLETYTGTEVAPSHLSNPEHEPTEILTDSDGPRDAIETIGTLPPTGEYTIHAKQKKSRGYCAVKERRRPSQNTPYFERSKSAIEPTQSASLDALDTLTKKKLFANCYSIESKGVNGKAHVLFAEDINTGTAVVLKFYANRLLFENSRSIHRKLKHSDHVCKQAHHSIPTCNQRTSVFRMLAAFDGWEDYPPCLVFERGHDTLEDWMKKARPSKMDRRCVLFQILTALEDVHSHDVVHCDLKPSNIMVFNSVYKWKLIDFDSATTRGEGAQIHATPAYAAPEIIEAACSGEKEIAVDTFADMWSFGIIAFEMLKGTRFYGPCPSLEDVRDRLTFENLSSTIQCLEEKQENSLIKHMIRIKPMERLTATKARKKGIFDYGMDTSEMAAGLNHVAQVVNEILTCSTLTLRQMDLANLAVAIGVEELVSTDDPCVPFRLCDTEKVFTMADDFLPDDPIFILRCGQKHRLRIYLHALRGVSCSIRNVLAIEATLKDGSRAQLEMIEEDSQCHGKELVALLDPGSFDGSDLLDIPCPMFGDETKRYLPVKLKIKFVTRAGREQFSQLEHTIFCKMVRDSRMKYQKFKRVVEMGWRNVPQWVRDGGRVSLSLANIALNVV